MDRNRKATEGTVASREQQADEQEQAKPSTDITLSIVDTDHLNPEQAEHRVVGGLLRFGSACSLKLQARHFFSPLLALIFAKAIARCDAANFSEELVIQSLDASGELRMVGGLSFLADLSLFQAPPTPDAVGYWAERVHEAWHRRESMVLLSTALESFCDGEATEDVWKAIGRGYRSLRGDCDV